MPAIGDIVLAKDLGRKGGSNNRAKYIWTSCVDCGRERWVFLAKGKPVHLICNLCWGKYVPRRRPIMIANGTVNNPQIGDIRYGDEIGAKAEHKHIWFGCITCGKTRWVLMKNNEPKSQRCPQCRPKHLKVKPLKRGLLAKGTIDNPEVGDIRYGDERGLKAISHKYIWSNCRICGSNPKWRSFVNGEERKAACHRCLCGENASCRKHYSYINNQGYRLVYILYDSPFSIMVAQKQSIGGFVLEHRLIMAQYLNRPLKQWETVHHLNHIRNDNRIDNLKLMVVQHHNGLTIMEHKTNRLYRKVTRLNAIIINQSNVIKMLLMISEKVAKKKEG
ncbi:hypothetical protein LCGC14_1391560 [marine sediment metagenome]|uniref:HNH nuclease domain-containing protein n=1 Tax=marine sediment metagenome TaxID=412755 RepID=A0A0F9KKM9_9ZZZZ